jgi:hypothetical protein
LEIFDFASVTYCTNVPAGEYPSDDEAEYVATQIAEIFQAKLRESIFADDITVVRVEFEKGCILSTITLGATLLALHKFIKGYPKFRPGLLLLLKDLNGIYIRFKGSSNAGSTYIMREDIPEQTKLETTAKECEVGAKKPSTVTKRVTRRSDKEKK